MSLANKNIFRQISNFLPKSSWNKKWADRPRTCREVSSPILLLALSRNWRNRENAIFHISPENTFWSKPRKRISCSSNWRAGFEVFEESVITFRHSRHLQLVAMTILLKFLFAVESRKSQRTIIRHILPPLSDSTNPFFTRSHSYSTDSFHRWRGQCYFYLQFWNR